MSGTPQRPTQIVDLRCGWKAEIVTYFTQGEFEQIKAIFLDELHLDVKTKEVVGSIKADVSRRANELGKRLAVKRLWNEQGYCWEDESLTIDILLSVPFDPDGDELAEKIDALANPKKKVTETSSS